MQQPTCRNVRIRSTQDANCIFYAIQEGLLHMVTRRLDANERLALTSGCVYAWEERGPHSEVTGLGIERFTEGRRWSPSRVRDEFLFYYEKYTPDAGPPGLAISENPPRNWDPLVKQTYSVWVDTPKGRRKWHLTAYFTQATVDDLKTIDNIPCLKGLVVPHGLFKSTRISKGRSKSEEKMPRPADPPSNSSTFSPFLTLRNQYPNELALAPSVSDSVTMYEPYPNFKHNPYPNQYRTTPPPVYFQPGQGSPPSSRGTYTRSSTFSPTSQERTPPHIAPHPGYMTALNSGTTAPTTPKSYQSDSSTQAEFGIHPHHSPLSTSLPSLAPPSSQWIRTPVEPFNAQLPPLRDPVGAYPFLPTPNSGPEHPRSRIQDPGFPDSTSSNASGPPPRRREKISIARVDPSYELYSQPQPDGRRSSIGPDRDLASIHTLTRRQPYRRDPLDDSALRRFNQDYPYL